MKRHHDDAPARIHKSYTALICADGRILPITESIGRRVLREIDPAGREGRELLASGTVTLWTSDGKRHQKLKVAEILTKMKRDLDRKISSAPRDPRVGALYKSLAKSVTNARTRHSQ
ncbi:MAG: hypothetical protein HY049_05435 [Acidobacteria bacterium]|nr:hypothetical protein [Acidobacteriota bacterium]